MCSSNTSPYNNNSASDTSISSWMKFAKELIYSSQRRYSAKIDRQEVYNAVYSILIYNMYMLF